mmetsp:Transcript_16737/g.31707  ORF Transcript_16737/g.31707 Transcript_16737/m.31707 type:complete len:238 (-) Transcript_16737:9-722(-)
MPSFSSIRDFISSFADEQNLERLKQCAEIEQALRQCERIQQAVKEGGLETSSASTSTAVTLQDSRAGMKIARFYGWGLRNPKAEEAVAAMRAGGGNQLFYSMQKEASSQQQQQQEWEGGTATDGKYFSGNASSIASSSPAISCSKEHHALWGCRAMAVGCAKELVELKKCFEENHSSDGNDPQYFCYSNDNDVKANGNNTAETGSGTVNRDKVCSESMRKLGECVTMKWKDLNERLH